MYLSVNIPEGNIKHCPVLRADATLSHPYHYNAFYLGLNEVTFISHEGHLIQIWRLMFMNQRTHTVYTLLYSAVNVKQCHLIEEQWHPVAILSYFIMSLFFCRFLQWIFSRSHIKLANDKSFKYFIAYNWHWATLQCDLAMFKFYF